MLSTAKSANVGFSQVVQLLYILALCHYTPFDYTALCIASKSICTGLALCIDSFCYTRSCQKTLTTLLRASRARCMRQSSACNAHNADADISDLTNAFLYFNKNRPVSRQISRWPKTIFGLATAVEFANNNNNNNPIRSGYAPEFRGRIFR